MCLSIFKSKARAKIHFETVHVGLKAKPKEKTSYTCQTCGKVLKGKQSLKNHNDSIHKEERKFDCDICTSKFKREQLLITHIKLTHNPSKARCNICGSEVKAVHMQSHLKRMHSDSNKVFKCTKCERIFNRQILLNRHMKLIHGNSELKCSLCGKIFKNHPNLYSHVKRRHEENKKLIVNFAISLVIAMLN